MTWLRRIWLIVISRFTKRRQEPASLATLYAAGLVPEPEPVPEPAPEEEARPNRATRRAAERQRRFYERQRRKFDKFVTPQGPEPVKITRATATPVPQAPLPAVEDEEEKERWDDFAMVDVHHSDRKTKVLYEINELYGQFNFRDTILDDIERYFVYLERMRRRDPQSYNFYRHVGAMLVPYAGIGDIYHELFKPKKKEQWEEKPLSPWFRETRPAFGCIAYGTNPEIERIEREKVMPSGTRCWVPKFMYFTKYKRERVPAAFERIHAPGDVYALTVWWDRTDLKRKYGTPQQFGIFVGEDGSMRALRCNEVRMLGKRTKHSFYHKTQMNPRGSITQIPQHTWAIPHEMHEWAKHHNINIQRFLQRLFVDLVDQVEEVGNSMARVSVEHDGRYAMFAIDIERAPYFFKDRDYALTDSGLRKRILHLVAPHRRRDGIYIPLHTRGAKEFTWAGYSVRITLPGKDHPVIEHFDIGVSDEEKMPKDEKRKSKPMEYMGERIRERMNTQ